MAKAKPIIGWNNLFERGSVVASTAAAGYEAANAYDGLSFDAWKATAVGASTIAVFCSAAQSVDCWGFYGSDLVTQGGTVKLEWSTDGTTWTQAGTTITPTHTGAHLQQITALSKPFWRLYVTSPGTPSYFTHVFVGAALTFEYGVRAGVLVPQLARIPVLRDNVSEGGAFLGRSVERRGSAVTLEARFMTEAYARATWKPFMEYAEKRAFLMAWEPGDNGSEVAFCRGKKQPVLAYDDAFRMSSVLDLECLVEPPAAQSALVLTARAAPASPAVTQGAAQGALDVSWSAVTPTIGTMFYNVYRSTTSGGALTLVSALQTAITFTDTGLGDNVRRYYKVTAVDVAGNESAYSSEVNAYTRPAIPTSPAAATGADYGEIDVTWAAVAGATSYNVYQAPTSGGTYVQVATGVAVTNKTITGLANGTTFYFKVTAVISAVESNKSAEVSAATLALVTPTAPTLDSVTAVGGTTTGLTTVWTAPGTGLPLSNYKIYRDTAPGVTATPGLLVGTVSGTTLGYADLTVSAGVTYYYVITAVNPAGEGPISNELSGMDPM